MEGDNKEHSHVTITFELDGIDHNRFIEWLQYEYKEASDGAGDTAGKVRMVDPIGIALHNWEGR